MQTGGQTRLDLVLIFPPISISHGSPELGMPELTANLRAKGFAVEQHDWNIEFLADYLLQPDNLRAVLASMAGDVFLPVEAARSPRMFLDLLFARGVAHKSKAYNGEPTEDFSEFLAINRAKYSLCHGLPDVEVRRRLDTAWPDGPMRPADGGSWSSSPDDLVRAVQHLSKNYANFFVDFLEGLQEVWLTPRSYRMEDVLKFVSHRAGVFETFFEKKLEDVWPRGGAKVLGCSIYAMSQVAPSLVLARVAKRMDPRVRVVFGGPWCGMARRLFPTIPELFEDVDGVVLYEGERPLAEYLGALRSSADPDSAPNLVHRKKGVVIENPVEPPLPLFDLEFPTYDGLPMALYFDRKLTLRLFRGCYWGRCIFCNDTCDSVARLAGFHSGRSDVFPASYLDRMVEHIRGCARLYGQYRFNHADTTVPPGMLHQFAETLLKRNLSIEWFSFMRFVPISKRTCRTMDDSGCRELKIGLESTSDNDLRRLRKGFSMRTVHQCLDAFEGTDIRILAFMMGLPYQTPEEFTTSLRTVVEGLPRVDDTILQRFVLVRESPLLRDPESFGMRVTADLRRDLRVYALEYENLGGMNLYQFMSLANSMHKFLNYSRARSADRTDLYRNQYWPCRERATDGSIQAQGSKPLLPKGDAARPRWEGGGVQTVLGTTRKGFSFVDRLERIDLGVTNRCNQECVHCCNRPQRGLRGRELSLEEIERVGRECRALGAWSLGLYGGEPTLREDLPEIVRVLVPHIPTVELDTNGRRLDTALALRLKAAGLSRVYVSVLGADEEGHRAVAGSDTFRQALDAIRTCIAVGLPVKGSTVITRPMVRDGGLKRLIALMHEVGAEGLRVLYPMATGAWAGRSSELLSPEEKREADSYLDGQFTNYTTGSTTINCQAVYKGYLFVGPFGEVLPCPNIPLVLGNIREEPLTSLLRRSQWDYLSCGWARYFDQPGCPMSDQRAFEIVPDGLPERRYLPNRNYVDLGGVPAWANVRSRAERPTDDVLRDLEEVVRTEHHVYLTGRSLADHPAASCVVDALAARGRAATVVDDPRRLASLASAGLLETGVVRSVIVPLELVPPSRGPRERGASRIPGILADGTTLREIARAVRSLQVYGITGNFLVNGGGPEEVAQALPFLIPLNPREVLLLRPGAETPQRPETWPGVDPVGMGRHIRRLFPWADVGATRVELVAFRQVVVPAYDVGSEEWFSPEALESLEGRWLRAIEHDPRPRTWRLSLDSRGLVTCCDLVERLVPLMARSGARVVLRRVGVGPCDFGEQLAGIGALQEGEVSAHRRLAALVRAWPSSFVLRGLGPALFRPWNTADEVFEVLAAVLERSGLTGEDLERYLQWGILADLDPPGDGTTPAAWRIPPPPWSFRDPEVARLYHFLRGAASGTASAQATPTHDPDEAAGERVVRDLPGSSRLARVAEALCEARPPLGQPEDLEARVRSRLQQRLFAVSAGAPEAAAWAPKDPSVQPNEAQEGRTTPNVLEQGIPVVERVLRALETHPRSPLPGFRLVSLTPALSEVGTVLDAVLARGDRQIALRLSPTDGRVSGLVALPLVTLSYSPDTPLAGPAEVEGLKALARLINRYLEKVAKDRALIAASVGSGGIERGPWEEGPS